MRNEVKTIAIARFLYIGAYGMNNIPLFWLHKIPITMTEPNMCVIHNGNKGFSLSFRWKLVENLCISHITHHRSTITHHTSHIICTYILHTCILHFVVLIETIVIDIAHTVPFVHLTVNKNECIFKFNYKHTIFMCSVALSSILCGVAYNHKQPTSQLQSKISTIEHTTLNDAVWNLKRWQQIQHENINQRIKSTA